MSLSISNLNNLLTNFSPISNSSQNTDAGLIVDPTLNADTSGNSTSLLTSSLSGSQDGNGNNTSFLLSPLLTISQTAQILSKRQNSISKMLTAITDNTNLVQTAQTGLTQGKSLLNSLKDLLTQAQNPSLSSEERTAISQKIGSTLEAYARLVDVTQYSGNKVLSKEDTIFVNTNEAALEDKIQIHFSDLSSENLGLDQLDASSPQKAVQSLDILNKALFTFSITSNELQNIYSQLNNSADSLQKSLQGILKVQSINSETANALAQSIASSDLSKTQNIALLASIAPSLL
ncbi:MAG: hypothetical protein HQM15_03590 [Deltaproteobacteria bacterium]|nr:hypothetical protein [Deltaproteobacteria bacterium]